MWKVEEIQKSQKKKVSSTLDPMNVLLDSDSTFLRMIIIFRYVFSFLVHWRGSHRFCKFSWFPKLVFNYV